MNKFLEWLGTEMWNWIGVLIVMALGAGLLFGCLWFASWAIKGFFAIWGLM